MCENEGKVNAKNSKTWLFVIIGNVTVFRFCTSTYGEETGGEGGRKTTENAWFQYYRE